jgi:hypothetical protein
MIEAHLKRAKISTEAEVGVVIWKQTDGSTDKVIFAQIAKIQFTVDEIPKLFGFEQDRDIMLEWQAVGLIHNAPLLLDEVTKYVYSQGEFNVIGTVYDIANKGNPVPVVISAPELVFVQKESTVWIGQNDDFLQSVCELKLALKNKEGS